MQCKGVGESAARCGGRAAAQYKAAEPVDWIKCSPYKLANINTEHMENKASYVSFPMVHHSNDDKMTDRLTSQLLEPG